MGGSSLVSGRMEAVTPLFFAIDGASLPIAYDDALEAICEEWTALAEKKIEKEKKPDFWERA